MRPETEAKISAFVEELTERENLSRARQEAAELTLRALAEAGEWPKPEPGPDDPSPSDYNDGYRRGFDRAMEHSPKLGDALAAKISDHILKRCRCELGDLGVVDDKFHRLIPILVREALK
jgi:hypothetical protein